MRFEKHINREYVRKSDSNTNQLEQTLPEDIKENTIRRNESAPIQSEGLTTDRSELGTQRIAKTVLFQCIHECVHLGIFFRHNWS